MVLGGEVARRSDWALFCTRFARGTRLVNGYGLTESTVVSQWQGDHDSRVAGELLPLGWPVAGIEVELRDASGAAELAGRDCAAGRRGWPRRMRGASTGPGTWDAGRRTASWPGWAARNGQHKLNGVRVAAGRGCVGAGPWPGGDGLRGGGSGSWAASVGPGGLCDGPGGRRGTGTAAGLGTCGAGAVAVAGRVAAARSVLPVKANGKLDESRLPALDAAGGHAAGGRAGDGAGRAVGGAAGRRGGAARGRFLCPGRPFPHGHTAHRADPCRTGPRAGRCARCSSIRGWRNWPVPWATRTRSPSVPDAGAPATRRRPGRPRGAAADPLGFRPS